MIQPVITKELIDQFKEEYNFFRYNSSIQPTIPTTSYKFEEFMAWLQAKKLDEIRQLIKAAE
ncbi:MAG: hypothetical protein JST70_02375 [Bacteroidetes bacterium]|nr:hypothetical protein [Bacteroidota bacterium]